MTYTLVNLIDWNFFFMGTNIICLIVNLNLVRVLRNSVKTLNQHIAKAQGTQINSKAI